jgi:hypothetical protein
MKICEDEHTFKVGLDNDELKGMTPQEAQQHIKEMRKNFEAKYVVYLGHTMLQYQHRESVVAPYNFE